jgi:hypothetical protein
MLSLFSSSLLAQIKSSDLIGEWTTCNEDSLYYTLETVELHQDANYNIQTKCCHYLNWKITSKKSIKIEELFTCTEPGRLSSSNLKETFKVVKCADGQMIVLKRGKEEIDKFMIVSLEERKVDRYPHYIKILTLKRM